MGHSEGTLGAFLHTLDVSPLEGGSLHGPLALERQNWAHIVQVMAKYSIIYISNLHLPHPSLKTYLIHIVQTAGVTSHFQLLLEPDLWFYQKCIPHFSEWMTYE